MKFAVLTFHLICCCAMLYLYPADGQMESDSYSNARQYIEQYRKEATIQLRRVDELVFSESSALSRLRQQLTGNKDHDFMKIEKAMLDAEIILNVTAALRARDDSLKSAGSVGSCLWEKALQAECSPKSKYRTASGHCNNLRHKTAGMAGTSFVSRLPTSYQDYIQAPRVMTHYSNQRLPNARKVSIAITTITNSKTTKFSSQLMQWGQLVAHDITSIRDVQSDIVCCPGDLAEVMFSTTEPSESQLKQARDLIQSLRSDACIPVEAENDPIYGYVCMSQVRSGAVPNINCSPSVRLQTNTATHFVDASSVYGCSTGAMNKLRSMRGGKLKVQVIEGKELPPKEKESCTSKCPFTAGDVRINTTPNLISIHTLFIKKHNQICDELAKVNPHWDDEKLFQEARRIISAIQQKINFNEWLPNVLGPIIAEKYRLTPYIGREYRHTYNSNVDPTLINELAGAAHRFGHTAVRGSFECGGSQELKHHFEKPDLIYRVGIDKCISGLGMQPPGDYDASFAGDMRDELLKGNQDIVTMNVNRGRELGYQSYDAYRKEYKLGSITSWDSLRISHTVDAINALKSIYDDPRDIELFAGGISEKPLINGYVGPLFAEIIADGYSRLRDGDRFYYESPTAGFKIEQVNAIRAYSYANLICDVGGVMETPKYAFHLPGYRNPMLQCDRSFKLEMELWRDDPSPSRPRPSPSWHCSLPDWWCPSSSQYSSPHQLHPRNQWYHQHPHSRNHRRYY